MDYRTFWPKDWVNRVPDGSILISFVAASLVILIIPGPGVLYVVARGMNQGHYAGFVSAIGLSVGVFAHVFAAAVGLSALLLTSATAFMTVKYLGAVYLVYLGLQAFRSKRALAQPTFMPPQPLYRLFLDGVIISVFNPKVAIFFLAFLPQFVSSEAGSASTQILKLGLLYALLALVTDSTYGFIAASLKAKFHRRSGWDWILRYIAGSLFIGLGLKAALTTQKS